MRSLRTVAFITALAGSLFLATAMIATPAEAKPVSEGVYTLWLTKQLTKSTDAVAVKAVTRYTYAGQPTETIIYKLNQSGSSELSYSTGGTKFVMRCLDATQTRCFIEEKKGSWHAASSGEREAISTIIGVSNPILDPYGDEDIVSYDIVKNTSVVEVTLAGDASTPASHSVATTTFDKAGNAVISEKGTYMGREFTKTGSIEVFATPFPLPNPTR